MSSLLSSPPDLIRRTASTARRLPSLVSPACDLVHANYASVSVVAGFELITRADPFKTPTQDLIVVKQAKGVYDAVRLSVMALT